MTGTEENLGWPHQPDAAPPAEEHMEEIPEDLDVPEEKPKKRGRPKKNV